MIFILSEEEDFSTSEVIGWLLYYKAKFVRWNEEDFIEGINITYDEDIQIFIRSEDHQKEIDLASVKMFWYRRGDFYLTFPMDTFSASIKKHLLKEWKVINFFLHNYLSNKDGIGNFFKEANFDKLHQLALASSVGLDIPNTIISDKKDNFSLCKEKKYITKFIDSGMVGELPGFNFFAGGTNKVTNQNLLMLDDRSYPTLIQEQIEKEYELRIFYIDEEFFPMAIFSQNNEQTQLDFRNYDPNVPNRNVPYVLPEEIKNKLIKVTRGLQMNTGSKWKYCNNLQYKRMNTIIKVSKQCEVVLQ